MAEQTICTSDIVASEIKSEKAALKGGKAKLRFAAPAFPIGREKKKRQSGRNLDQKLWEKCMETPWMVVELGNKQSLAAFRNIMKRLPLASNFSKVRQGLFDKRNRIF